MNTYPSEFQESIQNPEAFWNTQAQQISWKKFPENILSKNSENYDQWFSDGTLNMSELCLDKHINEGYAEQVALIYDSPVTNTIQKFTYLDIYKEVNELALGISELGFTKGDTAIIYMPMIPQATFAMLACARLGITHSVVFGGFAPNELAIRIDDCQAKLILTASCGIEVQKVIEYQPLVEKAIELAQYKPSKTIIYNRGVGKVNQFSDNQLNYNEVKKEGLIPAVEVESTHPLYILYTSGTTGKPKGIVRDTGGYATALKYSMKNVYGSNEGDVFWAASDVGWVVGHSYILYGPLINRNTTILFEGKPIKTPDASTFFRIIEQHKVQVIFTAPTAFRAIRKEDPEGKMIQKHDLSSLKYQFLAGERCDASTLQWVEEKLQIPVIDHWWQTESGWPMLANMAGIELQKVKAGSATFPVPGYDVKILKPNAEEALPNEEGLVCVKLPLPPGTLSTIWNNPTRFKCSYLEPFPGYYFSGDGGFTDKEGYVFITGRVDDVINVAGHRLSTADMEEIVAQHPSVAECAVVGMHCDLKGQIPLAFVVTQSNVSDSSEAIQQEIIASVREKIGAVACFKKTIEVKRLPKTRSGKTLRNLLRKLADKSEFTIPSTIDDETIITEIQENLNQNNI